MSIAIRCAACLALILLLLPQHGQAQRRGIRVDAGAWGQLFPITSPSCTLDLPGTPRLVVGQDLLLSALGGSEMLAGASCQYTDAGAYNGAAFEPGEEDGLAALLGPNAGDAASATRYTFADEADPLFAPRAFQWYMHRLPGVTLLSLHLRVFGTPYAELDDSTHLIDLSNGNRLWGAGSDGFDGEYFCFESGLSAARYLGRWNGRADDTGSPCLHYLTEVRPLESQVVSRDGRGILLGAEASDAGFGFDHRFIVYSRVTEPITIFGPRWDAFEFDRALGTVRQLNLTADAQTSNASASGVATSSGAVTGEGAQRWVAFASRATNLVPGDDWENSDVFLEGPSFGNARVLRRVSDATDDRLCFGPSLAAAPDDDLGNFPPPRVAYGCRDEIDLRPSLWIADSDGSSSQLWSGSPGDSLSAPKLSLDGRTVVFATDVAIDPADTNGLFDVYAMPADGGSAVRVSVAPGGGPADGDSGAAEVSADGCVVVFESTATNLLAGVTASRSVYARNRCLGATELVSRGLDGSPIDANSADPSISADGVYVAFETDDTGVSAASGLTGPGPAVAVRRLGAGGQTRAVESALVGGLPFPRAARDPQLSMDARQNPASHRELLRDGVEGGHEVLLSVEDAAGEAQIAIVPSPFGQVSTHLFRDGFGP